MKLSCNQQYYIDGALAEREEGDNHSYKYSIRFVVIKRM